MHSPFDNVFIFTERMLSIMDYMDLDAMITTITGDGYTREEAFQIIDVLQQARIEKKLDEIANNLQGVIQALHSN